MDYPRRPHMETDWIHTQRIDMPSHGVLQLVPGRFPPYSMVR
jgi:hypothetical protein